MEYSRRQLLAIGGLGALAALGPLDIERRAASAAGTTATTTGTGVYPWVRDRIELNQAWEQEFRTELALRKVAPGTTVCLVAREIVHSSNYLFRLAGYPLVIAADIYDGRNGTVDTTDYATLGASAAPITLVAKQVVFARLIANGRNGEPGEPGEPGLPGEPSESGIDEDTGKPYCLANGGNGGGGGNGYPGGPGGNGGAITVYTTSTPGTLLLTSLGGAGGQGGSGGTGGAGGAGGGGCRAGRAGAAGLAGAVGPVGLAGVTSHTVLSEADWWAQATTRLGAATAEQWADYRTRVGEFLFRTFTPTDTPTIPPVRDRARGELVSALSVFALAALPKFTSSRARTLLGYLDNALTPIGLSYQHDLRPDFSFFEQFITDYQGRRDALFTNTLRLLVDVNNTADKSHLAAALKAHAAGMTAVAQKDYELALSERAQANLVLDHAKIKLARVRKEMQDLLDAHLRDDDEIDFGDFVKGVTAVVGAVIAIVTAVYSGGASVYAYLAVIGLAVVTPELGADIVVREFVDDADPSNPKATQAAKDATGNLTAIFNNTVKLVEKAGAIAQLFAAQGDSEFQAKERQLLIKAFDGTFEVNLQAIDVEQAKLAEESARLKWEVYQADVLALQALQSGFQVDLTTLIRTARTVLRQFQTFVDHFIAYGFRRDRAFDLYTLSPVARAPQFAFDYGYVHPDVEEDAYFALSRSDSSRVLGLLDQYVTSLAQFEPAQLREEYDDYWLQLSFDGNVAISITDPDVLQSLKGSASASFIVDLAGFTPHTELKIGRAEVALIGATTNPNHPWVQVELEHSGTATNLRRDGTVVTFDAPLRSEASPAQLTGINPDDLDETDKQVFWGRSPAARWRVSISPEAAAEAGLDLSGLTAVQLAVKYSYFNPTASLVPDETE